MVLGLLVTPLSFAQIPVGPVIDNQLIGSNTIVSLAEGVTNFLLKKERPLQENIKDVQEFFQKAETVVNGAIRNLRMVREIVETEKDIIELYTRSINKLNQPIDEDVLPKGLTYLRFWDCYNQPLKNGALPKSLKPTAANPGAKPKSVSLTVLPLPKKFLVVKVE